MQKLLIVSIIALWTFAVFSAAIVFNEINQAEAKKPTQVKCNNIKILIKVSGADANQTLVANVTLGTGFKSKTVTTEDNISTTIPIQFKKISPCPPIGFEYQGNVNGTDFTGKITDLKKPNRVTVALS